VSKLVKKNEYIHNLKKQSPSAAHQQFGCSANDSGVLMCHIHQINQKCPIPKEAEIERIL
jgi:hypothetical protein